jgi:hypothetical protein
VALRAGTRRLGGHHPHLRPQETAEETILLFTHAGWREPSEFMHHCSTKWAYFLLGLKRSFEGGMATPYPDDMAISSSWQ